MGNLTKNEFIHKFTADQKQYRSNTAYYETIREPTGKVYFMTHQLLDIKNRFKFGESMSSIGRSYECSRQTIRENLKKMGAM